MRRCDTKADALCVLFCGKVHLHLPYTYNALNRVDIGHSDKTHNEEYLISLWLVSTCISDLRPGTEYIPRTTQPNAVILDRTPNVSPR